MNEQISVKELLPEEYRKVICYDDQSETVKEAEFSHGKFNVDSCDNEIILYDVTHWMPLPEPPKA